MAEVRILVVDDEDLVRGVLILMLEDAGYATLGASDASKALSILEAGSVAAVVSDIDMPGDIDGLELAWEVSTRWPQTGILLMSGRALPRPNDLPAGTSFIAKPCNEVHFLELVAEAVLALPHGRAN